MTLGLREVNERSIGRETGAVKHRPLWLLHFDRWHEWLLTCKFLENLLFKGPFTHAIFCAIFNYRSSRCNFQCRAWAICAFTGTIWPRSAASISQWIETSCNLAVIWWKIAAKYSQCRTRNAPKLPWHRNELHTWARLKLSGAWCGAETCTKFAWKIARVRDFL